MQDGIFRTILHKSPRESCKRHGKAERAYPIGAESEMAYPKAHRAKDYSDKCPVLAHFDSSISTVRPQSK